MLKPIEFVHWLSGILAVNKSLNLEQTKIVAEKLDSIFVHVQPKPKPTLQDLLPGHVVTYSNVPLKPKPADWEAHWEHDPLHGWYDPHYGRPRC